MAWVVTSRFSILGFAPEGRVFYDYNLEGGTWPTGGFTGNAQGDLDDDDNVSTFTINNTSTDITHGGAAF